jgi:hypothetical protein
MISDFFIASMPDTRPADYYIGYMDGCVFLDFDNCENKNICLKRISFDGYGCCDLGNKSVPLSMDDSEVFKNVIQDDIKDQNILSIIIKKAISLNSTHIWIDALKEYQLI